MNEKLIEVAKMVDAWGNGLRHHTAHEAKMVKAARAALTPDPAVNVGALVPEGWQLVPMEPTREMWAAMADTLYGYKNRHHDKVAGDLFYAMLAAAPTPPQAGTEGETPAPQADVASIDDVLRPLHEAVNTRSHVKLSPSQANRILKIFSSLGEALSNIKSLHSIQPPQNHVTGWEPQRWMGPIQLVRKRDDTHEEAMTTILNADGLSTLSYEEAALCYARARGFIRDDAEMMCDPVKEVSND